MFILDFALQVYGELGGYPVKPRPFERMFFSLEVCERSMSFVAQFDRDKMLINQDHSALVLWIELAFSPFL